VNEDRVSHLLNILGVDAALPLSERVEVAIAERASGRLKDFAFVQECFELKDGELYWRERPQSHFRNHYAADLFNKKRAGTRVSLSLLRWGYYGVHVSFRGTRQHALAHRLVWALANGRMPEAQIDHINGDPLDNRPSNLRSVTRQENSKNLARRFDNKSGVSGVTWRPATNRWSAQAQSGGRHYRQRSCKTFEEAVALRLQWEKELGYHENHGTRQTKFPKAGRCEARRPSQRPLACSPARQGQAQDLGQVRGAQRGYRHSGDRGYSRLGHVLPAQQARR
jgi:hypothetical protein